MATEDDIARDLPDPPPPRPARRDAAIGEAMRRFDATRGATPIEHNPRAAPPQPARRWIARPQIAALAGVALVVSIGLPMWMSGDHGLSPPPQSNVVVEQRPDASVMTDAAVDQAAPTLPPKSVAPAPVPPKSGNAPVVSSPAPALSAPMVAPPAMAAPTLSAPIAQKQSRASNAEALAFAPAPPPPPPPPAPAVARAISPQAASSAASLTEDNAEIVVTGSRVRPVKRGDWNACTVNDPKRDLAVCKRQVDAAAPGVAGRSSAYLADGLSRAWQGEEDGAIAAFDRAIAIAPRSAPAYLNRGLAYQRNGDLARAIADLDKAVRIAPNAARYRYARSVMLREQGDTRRADADERHALELDSRYEAVIE